MYSAGSAQVRRPMLFRNNHFQTIPHLQHSWVAGGSAAAIPPVLNFYKWLRNTHPDAAVIFLTERRRSEYNCTEYNLNAEGFTDFTRLVVRELEDRDNNMATYKLRQREKLEAEGFTIVATVGDQWSDFSGGHTGYVVKLPNYLYTIE